MKFNHLILQAHTDLLGAGMPKLQTRPARLPVAMGDLGLQAATDYAAAANVSSIVASKDQFRAMLGTEEDQPSPPICLSTLDTLATNFGEVEPVTEASLEGLNQRQLSLKVNLANQRLLSHLTEIAGEREVAWLSLVTFPHAGKWLNCPPPCLP